MVQALGKPWAPSSAPVPKPRRKRGGGGGSYNLPSPRPHSQPLWLAPRPATPEPAQLHVLSSSPTHCSARNILIQVAREMTALPGDQAVAQNKLQPSFLLAILTQVRGVVCSPRSEGRQARRWPDCATPALLGQKLPRGSGARHPVSLAPAHQMPEHPTVVTSQKSLLKLQGLCQNIHSVA